MSFDHEAQATMSTTEASQPHCGDLLKRMIVLARLCEQLGPADPSRLLLQKILRRLMLFSRMTDRLGLAAAQSPLVRAVLHQAEFGCLDCTEADRCGRWLDGKAPEDDDRAFCANAALFDTLPHQHSVMRPYGAD